MLCIVGQEMHKILRLFFYQLLFNKICVCVHLIDMAAYACASVCVCREGSEHVYGYVCV